MTGSSSSRQIAISQARPLIDDPQYNDPQYNDPQYDPNTAGLPPEGSSG